MINFTKSQLRPVNFCITYHYTLFKSFIDIIMTFYDKKCRGCPLPVSFTPPSCIEAQTELFIRSFLNGPTNYTRSSSIAIVLTQQSRITKQVRFYGLTGVGTYEKRYCTPLF